MLAAWLLLWLDGSHAVRAQTVRAHLTVDRPVDSFCPTAQALQSDVEALAGRTLFTSGESAEVSLECTLTEDDEGARADIEVRGADGTLLGTRQVRSESGECASLRRPLAFVLWMLLERDPHEAGRGGGARSGPRRALGFGASFAGSSGILPRPSPGFGASLRLGVARPVDLRFDGEYWLPVRAETSSGAGAVLRGFSLGGAVCPALLPAARGFGLAMCAGAHLVSILAIPRGLTSEADKWAFFGQALFSVDVGYRWSRAWLFAELGPSVAFSRPEIYLTRSDGSRLQVHRAPRLGALLRLTLIIPAR